MATLAQARVRTDAQRVEWVLFLDGIPYAWATDIGQGVGGNVLGSGASSWIGLSEDAIGGVEVVGARTVLGGLEMPGVIREALDVKAGEPEPNAVTFRLHDLSGLLGPLFAREGKAYDTLRSRVAPGTTATAATGVGPGGTSVDLWDRWIGLERIGPAGERRLFPCLPEPLVGFDHAVHQNGPLPGELPPVLVSDEPLAWAGRLVTLYAIYRDPDSTAATAAAWPTWDLQHAGGGRQWVGVVRGVKRQRGGVYELECHGRDALMRRQLGTVTTRSWMPIGADLNYGDDSIAVFFQVTYSDGSAAEYFDGSVYDRTLTAVTRSELITEINGIIQDAYDGTSTNYTGSAGVLDAWTVGADAQNASVGLDATGFYVRKDTQASSQTFLTMHVSLPSRVLRQLGFEPETQHFDGQHTATEDTKQIYFQKLAQGRALPFEFSADATPGTTYWRLKVNTIALGYTQDVADSNEWDNIPGGAPRYWTPKFGDAEPFTIDMTGGGQIIRIGGAAPYIEGQLTVYHTGDDVDGSASTQARYFALRGKVQRTVDGEPEDTIQVVLLEWDEDGHGNISVGATGFEPALRVVRWLDPRLFGFNYKPLAGDLEYWSGLEGSSGDDGVIECLPLHAYAYMMDDTPEYAHSVLTQILLSTGSGGGYNVAGTITAGDNSVGALDGTLFFGDDLELADMGLGIPQQLVAPLEEIRDAFDSNIGGWAGPLNRVRYAYAGPFQALDTISSLFRSRRLMHRWHGDVFGVAKLAPFSPADADITVLEADLYPTDNDPRSLMPDQLPAPMGHLDGIRLHYRWAPDDAKTQLEHVERALDADARSRTGDLIEDIEDHGLVPWAWGLRPDLVGSTPWDDELRTLWAHEACGFFGAEHFAAVMVVSRPKGQDIRLGTRVLVTNPWLVDSAGTSGVTNHVGVVTATDLDPVTFSRRCEIFVFAGQAEGYRYFAPSARVTAQAGAVLTLSTDQYGHGNADIYDAQGFVEPSWSTIGGSAIVQILYRIGETWTLGGTHTVSSYNVGSAQLTLTTTPDTTRSYTDRWVIFAGYDTQTANTHPRGLYGPIVLDTLQHGAGPTDGVPFQP
jgi:hypothetical protein